MVSIFLKYKQENSQIDDYESFHVINFDPNRKICIVGINKLTGHKHFIKIMKCDDVLNENEIKKEIRIMDKLKHENIISMKISSIEKRNRKSFASFLNHEQIKYLPEGETDYLFVSLEYCSHGNLKKWIEMNRELISKKENVEIIKQIICALHYLKSKNLIHRDVQVIYCTSDNLNRLCYLVIYRSQFYNFQILIKLNSIISKIISTLNFVQFMKVKSIFVDEKNVIKIGNFKSVSYLKENVSFKEKIIN
jgi:serine/threonine protein kinase